MNPHRPPHSALRPPPLSAFSLQVFRLFPFSLQAFRPSAFFLALFSLQISSLPLPAAPKPGEALPPWSEGFLDIHHINTGRGEGALLILPDGTTMLVDGGVSHVDPSILNPPVPSAERAPGEWIARYIDRALQPAPKKILNYVLLSHFDGDHLGTVKENTPLSANGHYKISGLSEIADFIPFEKLIDRSWPKYGGGLRMTEYQKFIAWQQKHKGMRPERFKAGVNDQFVLLHNPSKYPQFEIRNIASDGVVWTGKDDSTRDIFEGIHPDFIAENTKSTVICLTYGPFKYFSGGDLDHRKAAIKAGLNIETPVSKVTGPVSVLKANHHGIDNANSANFLANLRPRVIVVHTMSLSTPRANAWRRMKSEVVYPGPRDIFATCISKEAALAIGDKNLQTSGHIVIRVSPGGTEYYVYRLTDADESGLIKSVHGPYQAEHARSAP